MYYERTAFSFSFRYVLGVESPLVCDIIHLADENGMMDINRKEFTLDTAGR